MPVIFNCRNPLRTYFKIIDIESAIKEGVLPSLIENIKNFFKFWFWSLVYLKIGTYDYSPFYLCHQVVKLPK